MSLAAAGRRLDQLRLVAAVVDQHRERAAPPLRAWRSWRCRPAGTRGAPRPPPHRRASSPSAAAASAAPAAAARAPPARWARSRSARGSAAGPAPPRPRPAPAAPAHRPRARHRRGTSSGAAECAGMRQQRLQRAAAVSGCSAHSRTPASAAASAAITPAPPPLLRIASCSLRLAAKARQRLRRQEHLLQRAHAQHAGARDGRVVHPVGIGRCPGAAPAGAHHDHRLVARRRARRRHELARRLDRFDVEQDRARARVAGQHGRACRRSRRRRARPATPRCEKPMPRARGPVEHRGDQRARLRHEGQLAGQPRRCARCWRSGRGAATAGRCSRAQHAQQVRPRRIEHGLALRRIQPGAEHDGGARAAAPQLGDDAGHGGRAACRSPPGRPARAAGRCGRTRSGRRAAGASG